MKYLKVLSGLSLLTILALLIISGRKSEATNDKISPKRDGTAIVMTGAAARIPQPRSPADYLLPFFLKKK